MGSETEMFNTEQQYTDQKKNSLIKIFLYEHVPKIFSKGAKYIQPTQSKPNSIGCGKWNVSLPKKVVFFVN